MANKAPAYQYYADKFKAATRHLSRPARDIYREILDWMWLESSDFSSILCTERAVRHAAQCTKREYEKYFLGEIQNPLQPLLKVVDNRYISNGLRKEAEKHAARHGRAVAGANARWGGCLEHSTSIAQARPKQCTPSPSPTPSPTTLKNKPHPLEVPKPDAPVDDLPAGSPDDVIDELHEPPKGHPAARVDSGFLTGYARKETKCPQSYQSIHDNIVAAMEQGVTSEKIDAALRKDESRGKKIWEILDPLIKERKNAHRKPVSDAGKFAGVGEKIHVG